MTFSVNGTTVITTDRIVTLTSGTTASRPASPVVGQLFFDTTLLKMIVWNGTAWRESVSGTTPAEIPSAWAWGDNSRGQLGDTTATNRSSPITVVGGFTDWVQIVGGGQRTSAALRANGQAWTWGYNLNGRLGDNTTTNRSSPVSVVGGISNWIQISVGGGHMAGIRSNGVAWCWGYNNRGQLGDNSISNRSSPVSVAGSFTDWIQISAGSNHTVAIRSTGEALAWGYNNVGQLGNTSITNRSVPLLVAGVFTDWAQVSAGYRFTVGIRANGTAWAWGINTSGRLGDNTTVSKRSPVAVVGGFTDWVQIAAGYSHTAAIRANGQAWCWGYNYRGGLGDNTTAARSSPVSVVGGIADWVQISAGEKFTVAVRANGQAWAWGYNLWQNLGTSSAYTTNVSPQSVIGGFTDWVQISAGGGRSTMALRTQPRTKTIRPTNQRSRS